MLPACGTLASRLSLLAALFGATVTCGNGTDSSETPTIAIRASVNGGTWRPGTGPGSPLPYATLYEGNGVLVVGGLSGAPPRMEQLILSLHGVTGPGTFLLADTATKTSASYILIEGHLSDPDYRWTWYRTSDSVGGTAVLTTFDPGGHRLSGTFRFDALSPQGVLVHVTDGSFDGRYSTSPLAGIRATAAAP
jgi:Family of unknown function (DUF6252)